MMKWFGRIVVMLEVVFLLWLFVSWVDIIADNTQPNPQHSQYNAFVMMVENFEEKNWKFTIFNFTLLLYTHINTNVN